MKIIYEGYRGKALKPSSEWGWEIRKAVKTALELTEGKHGFKTPFEIWRNCELIITLGHNIYTTSIEIRPPKEVLNKRRANWHNSYAYFGDGAFWANFSHIKVELI